MSGTTNPIGYLTKKVWEYSRGNRGWVVFYSILFVFANLIAFLEPLIVAKLLNVIQESGITPESFPVLMKIILLFLILDVGFWAFHGPARVIERKNAFLVRANYKRYLIDGTLDLPPEWHTDHHSGDTFDKIEKGTTALYTYAGRTYEIIETIIRFTSSYIALVYFNLHSAYIVMFLFMLTIWMIIRFDKYLAKQYKVLFGIENEISAKIFDVITNITTVIILRIEKLLSKAIFKKIMKPFDLYRLNLKVSELKWFLVSMSTSLMYVLVLGTYLLSSMMTKTVILAGTVYVLYGYLQRIASLFFRFAYRYGEIVRQAAKVDNAEEIAKSFRVKNKTKSIDLKKHKPVWQKIEIKRLNFSYDDEKKGNLHLDDVNMTIRRGQRIALIGESGGGKSTILKVIRGLYTAKDCKVRLDGMPLKRRFDALSDNITLIPQDPEIFTATIKENITMGIGYSMAHIRKYTDLAMFTAVASKLPKKFNSSIVEKGVNLSGGEKQRLALARGLLASEDKEIVLLDEPTSSVDPKNELEIYSRIFSEFRGKTIISSIHRLHLLVMFDEIYFFSGGKVKAVGTFEELLEKSYEFRTMWRRYTKTIDSKAVKDMKYRINDPSI